MNSARGSRFQQERAIVWQREGGHCAWCGDALGTTGYHVHHRRLRSQRGSDDIDHPAWLVALHPRCHADIHAHPAESTIKGFIIPATSDPWRWPLALWDRSVVVPSDDGWGWFHAGSGYAHVLT